MGSEATQEDADLSNANHPQMLKLLRLSDSLQALCADLKLDPRYAARVEPIGPRDNQVHLTFTFAEEEQADQLIRAARRTLASFGPEYWLPNSHPQAAQFRQDAHIQFKVRKRLIKSHMYWGVSFILCDPEEDYSMVEDIQP
jgi:hypothetical protein